MELLQEYILELAVAVLALFYIITTVFFWFRLRNYKKLSRLVEGGNIEDHIMELEKRTKTQAAEIADLHAKADAFAEQLSLHPHVWELVRYNAFDDTGGELSFSLVLIDDHGNGFVLSAIHGREESRIYAKRIQKGKSQHTLSSEEQEALKSALKKARR